MKYGTKAILTKATFRVDRNNFSGDNGDDDEDLAALYMLTKITMTTTSR